MSANRFGNSQCAVRSMEITLETRRVDLRFGRHRNSMPSCSTCGAGYRMVTAFAAATLADVNCHTIYRWAETGEIHFNVTDEGSLLVCLNSLYERDDCDNPQYQIREQQPITIPA